MVIFIMQGLDLLGRRQAVSQVIAAGSAACSVEKPMKAEDMTIPGALQRLIASLSFYGMDRLYE